MAISYPLTLPNSKYSRLSISAGSAVSVGRSNYSFKTQVQSFSGKMWFAEVTFPAMKREEADKWISFLLKLNGAEGTFLLGDYSRATPKGSVLGSPTVRTGSQTGSSLLTQGWTTSTTNVLKAGDYIQIGQRLYMVLVDASSDSSGYATLDIFPSLRESPANGDTIITSNCVGLFRLANNVNNIYDVNAAFINGLSFSAEEAI